MSANRNRAKNLVRIMRENFQSAKKELGQNDVPNLSAHLCKQPSYSTPKFVECYCNPDGPHIKVTDFFSSRNCSILLFASSYNPTDISAVGLKSAQSQT